MNVEVNLIIAQGTVVAMKKFISLGDSFDVEIVAYMHSTGRGALSCRDQFPMHIA